MPVWKESFDFVIRVYEITKHFPKDERFGMISDMRRAANSIAHNIAEGFGRFEPRDKTRFYKIARGSAYELISQILVSEGLSFINQSTKQPLVEIAQKIIFGLDALIRSLES